jgi:hypothetical protein
MYGTGGQTFGLSDLSKDKKIFAIYHTLDKAIPLQA